MITIFQKKSVKGELKKVDRIVTGTWISVVDPTDEELKSLSEQFQLDESLLTDALDIHELPRYEVEDNIHYVFTRYIVGQGTSVTTVPMLIIPLENNLITISSRIFPRMERFESGRIEFTTQDITMLLSTIMRQISFGYTSSINLLGKRILSISRNVEKIQNKDIIQFIAYENILYDLNSALVRNDAIFRTLLANKSLQLSEDNRDLIEDLALENGQNMQIGKDLIRMLVNVREAHSTILTNNLNQVIKLFTSLTIILTVPTIIGTLYGMNVTLPLADNPLAFYEIVIISLVLMIILVVVFVKKEWL